MKKEVIQALLNEHLTELMSLETSFIKATIALREKQAIISEIIVRLNRANDKDNTCVV